MVLMERIVRPHLPFDTSVSKTAPKCRDLTPNRTAKFSAPANAANYYKPVSSPFSGGGFQVKDNQQQQQNQRPQEKTKNSSWAYAYKKYMTKKEKEQDKCKEDDTDKVVGGGASTDQAQT